MSRIFQKTTLVLLFAAFVFLEGGMLCSAGDMASNDGRTLATNETRYPLLSRRPPEEVQRICEKLTQAETAADAFESLGMFDRAKARWQDLRDLAQKEMPEATWWIAEAKEQVARMERAERFTDAEKKMWREIDSLQAEGKRLYSCRNFAEGNTAFDKASALAATLWGEKSDGHIRAIENAFLAAFAATDFARADQLARYVLLCQEHLQRDDSSRLGRVMLFLMRNANERRELASVVTYAERGYSFTEAHLAVSGRGRLQLLPWLQAIAGAKTDMGDYGSARHLCGQAIDILEKNAREPRRDYIAFLIQKGCVEIADGYFLIGVNHGQEATRAVSDAYWDNEAEPVLLKAHAGYLKALGAFKLGLLRTAYKQMVASMLIHETRSMTRNDMATWADRLKDCGMLLTDLGSYEDAEKALDQSDAVLAEIFPLGNWRTTKNKGCRGLIESRRGNHARAIRMLEEAVAECKSVEHKMPISYAMGLILLAEAQNAGGYPAQAEATLLECLAIRDKKLREGHPDRGEVLYELAAAYMSQKKYDQADKALAQAEAIYRKAVGERWPVYRNVLRRQVELYRAMDRQADAAKLDERVKALDAKYPPLQDLDDLPPSAFTGEPEEPAPKPDPA